MVGELRAVGPAGLEPATYGLKVRSSTIELEARTSVERKHSVER